MRALLLAALALPASAAAQAPRNAAPASPAVPEAGLVSLDDGTSDGLTWRWAPDPRWLDGAPLGRQALGGGLDFGDRFLGSTVPNREVPPLRIVFDARDSTVARVFDLYAGYVDAGTGVFPGAAYDVSDPAAPRRLNVAFTESRSDKPMDGSWNPDGSTFGAREYLFVLASNYDGDGSTHAGMNARDLDTYVGLAARVPEGRALYESSPATLEILPEPLRDVEATPVANGAAEVTWTAAAGAGADLSVLVVDAGVSYDAILGGASPEAGRVRLDGLDPARTYSLSVLLVTGTDEVVGARTVEVRPVISDGVAAASSRSPVPGGSYGDVWGYVAPDGREYGLLAVRNAGLSVLDVSEAPAAAPVEVGFVPTAEGAADSKDVKTYGRFAYLINEFGPVQIIDLADPAAPVQVGALDVQPGTPGGGAHNVLVANDHLWVVGGRANGAAGVRVYSLADPAAPAFVGAFHPTHHPTAYYHDFEVRGALALGSAIYDGAGVDVLDVSDPAAIRLVTTFTYPGAGAHNTCLTEDGAYVFVGDEIGSSGNWMRTFDLRDLDNPELVGEIVVNPEAVVHNCYVRGDLLFAAHYTEGLRVFDVSDPEHPVPTAFYDTYPAPGTGYLGAWTAYPYLPSGKVLLSDMQTGLWAFALDGTPVDDEHAPEAGPALTVAPNPVAASASVRFALPEAARVRLSVVDVRGREVVVLHDGPLGAGAHAAALRAGTLPAGVYLVRLGVDGRPAGTVRATVVR